MLVGSGRTIEWCKSQTTAMLVATYKCLAIYNAEAELAVFRAAAYSQSGDQDSKQKYQEELINLKNNA